MPLQILIGASLIIASLNCLQKFQESLFTVKLWVFFLCEYEALNDLWNDLIKERQAGPKGTDFHHKNLLEEKEKKRREKRDSSEIYMVWTLLCELKKNQHVASPRLGDGRQEVEVGYVV